MPKGIRFSMNLAYLYTFKQMPTLNMWLQIYGQKKHIIYLKAQIFLFFS